MPRNQAWLLRWSAVTANGTSKAFRTTWWSREGCRALGQAWRAADLAVERLFRVTEMVIRMTLERIRYVSFTFVISLFLAACLPSFPGIMRTGERMGWRPGRMPGRMPGEVPNQMPGQGSGPGGMGGIQSTPDVTPAPTATAGGAASVSYAQDIQPILDRACVMCHGGQAGLFVDSYDNLMAGGDAGKVVVPGDPQGSELVRRIDGSTQGQMPPGDSTLTSSEIDLIMTWIAEGSPKN